MSLEIIIPLVGLGSLFIASYIKDKCCVSKTVLTNINVDVVQTKTGKDIGWPCGESFKIVRKTTCVSEDKVLGIAEKWIRKNPEKVLIEICYWPNPTIFKLSGGYWTIAEWNTSQRHMEIKQDGVNTYRTLVYCKNNFIAKDFLNNKYNL